MIYSVSYPGGGEKRNIRAKERKPSSGEMRKQSFTFCYIAFGRVEDGEESKQLLPSKELKCEKKLT